MESVGVVADSHDEAVAAVKEGIEGVGVINVAEVGHVRFIRHTYRGPDTKTFVAGKLVNGV